MNYKNCNNILVYDLWYIQNVAINWRKEIPQIVELQNLVAEVEKKSTNH